MMKTGDSSRTGAIETGWLARSKAGHDKDLVYVIAGVDGNTVYVVDGKTKTLARPKKKNRKHLQMIHIRLETLLPKGLAQSPRDEHIRYALKQYGRRIAEPGTVPQSSNNLM